MDFKEVVKFHGHVCPGLAMGYRVAEFAATRLLFDRAGDEELVAVVENNSCAVDAIQVVLGCTAGKGNLIFKDYGKQVYTFFKRADGQALRVAIAWIAPAESQKSADMWQKFRGGDRSLEVVSVVNASKGQKVKMILEAADDLLFSASQSHESLPGKAQVFRTVICADCGEKCMEPKSAIGEDGVLRCLPCSQKDNS